MPTRPTVRLSFTPAKPRGGEDVDFDVTLEADEHLFWLHTLSHPAIARGGPSLIVWGRTSRAGAPAAQRQRDDIWSWRVACPNRERRSSAAAAPNTDARAAASPPQPGQGARDGGDASVIDGARSA